LIQQSSLQELLRAGFAPLEPLYRRWSEEGLIARYEEIVAAVMKRQEVLDLRSNRVLTPDDREALRPAVAELTRLCPDIMAQKAPEAAFQNAFVYEQAKRGIRRADRVVVIGGFEDPVGPALRELGCDVEITDPQLDGKDAAAAVWLDAVRSGRR